MKKYALVMMFITGTIFATPTVKNVDHTPWNTLLNNHVSDKGNVNYKAFKKDEKALTSYLTTLSQNHPDKTWSRNATLAYWINAYNAFTVQLILDNFPVKSIKDIKDPWDKQFINIGSKKYSLGDIEHKILRKMNEPRIHFAINCASFSCPNLLNEAFTDTQLEAQLKFVTKSFLSDTTKNTFTTDKIEISKIFDWFAEDFKTKGSLIDFINQNGGLKISSKAKIKYKEYNWNLNE